VSGDRAGDLDPAARGRLAPLVLLSVVPFVVLATLNAAGYRFGASDQAFYVPAVLERLDPALFPRDSGLIASQARLTLVDETMAALVRVSGASVPIVFGVLYVLSLALLAWGAAAIGGQVFRTRWAVAAFLGALTLKHAIAESGTNTLEGYFHPRQLAFGLGTLAVAAFLRGRLAAPGALVLCAGLVHPTTALWFLIWIAAAVFVAEPRLRVGMSLAAATGGAAGLWALTAGPLAGRLAVMDQAWLATLSSKDYLFPLAWPADAWLLNLAYIPIIVWALRTRRDAGLLGARERGMAAGCLALAIVFAALLPFNARRVALAVQLQPARVFWMVDFLAVLYAVWASAEGTRASARRAALVAAAICAVSMARGLWIQLVLFPDRPIATIDLPASDWGRAMEWARSSPKDSAWLADPLHAALYGTSLRVAGHRDVFVEELKDVAIGMYDRSIALRTRERLDALGDYSAFGTAEARALAARYGLDFFVTDRTLELPVAFSAGTLRIYSLR
jgi:hypothetical protein